jgi:YgiT-type zinc finger domain-containing protein
MTCFICENGEFENKKVDKPLTRDGKVILFTGVPAQVCDVCGERIFSREVVSKTLQYANEFFATGEQTRVVHYDDIFEIGSASSSTSESIRVSA